MNHLMLDLETWGTAPGSALRSIGAVFFDLDGKTGETFYRNIDKQSCLDAGLKIDPATVSWWSVLGSVRFTTLEITRPDLDVRRSKKSVTYSKRLTPSAQRGARPFSRCPPFSPYAWKE